MANLLDFSAISKRETRPNFDLTAHAISLQRNRNFEKDSDILYSGDENKF